ncbi:hypothetical protein KY290_010751 [Solanum tuberosum]|uniref:Reverse transcriptase domain-containing protein n=1 Tax=Solanum tuberosum TaxID=4113 RepID=A0ABQ7VYQ5_SOLTU|nr:hypothetical protein KY290_010751 [Solanum tuberosum]
MVLNEIRKCSGAEEHVLKQKSREPALVEEEFISFFSSLMGTTIEDLPSPNIEVIRKDPCLSYQQRCVLIVPVTDKEINEVMEGMAKDKTPGIDGFPAEFFLQHWSTVKDDVINVGKELFSTRKLLKVVNGTSITCMPKIATPTQVKDYRPIACCSTVYKIITKVLTNIIKLVIRKIVSPSQSASIEGKRIIDNILFSHEVLKWYSRKGMSPRCTMKVDLSKSYDSIEWEFLRKVFVELGFPFKFITWIMGVNKIVSREKGEFDKEIQCPFTFFFLAMEYLQRELEDIKLNKDFKYHPRCKKLGSFSASGLQANNEKSSIFMSGVKPELKQTFLETLGYVEGEVPFKYLGVSVLSKKLTIGQCFPLVEKIT